MNGIDVLHRYGAKRHYLPLERIVEDRPDPGVNYYEFTFTTNPRRGPRNLSYMLRMAAGVNDERTMILGAEPYDVRLPLFRRIASNYPVVYHTSWPYWTSGNVPRRPLLPGQRDRWLEFLSKVPVVTVTERAKRSLAAAGVDGRQIPHAVDTDVYNPQAGEAEGPLTVLFVGRLEERKGVDDLIRMTSEEGFEDVRFRFVGDGPMRDEVERLATADDVVYDGYVSDEAKLASIYASADLFVLPSRPADTWEELFGIVLIEAMAAGLPVVSTDCIGPEEVVDDGVTGIVVEKNDYQALKAAVKRFVDDEARRVRMGKAGEEKVQQNYSLAVVMEQWRDLLE